MQYGYCHCHRCMSMTNDCTQTEIVRPSYFVDFDSSKLVLRHRRMDDRNFNRVKIFVESSSAFFRIIFYFNDDPLLIAVDP